MPDSRKRTRHVVIIQTRAPHSIAKREHRDDRLVARVRGVEEVVSLIVNGEVRSYGTDDARLRRRVDRLRSRDAKGVGGKREKLDVAELGWFARIFWALEAGSTTTRTPRPGKRGPRDGISPRWSYTAKPRPSLWESYVELHRVPEAADRGPAHTREIGCFLSKLHGFEGNERNEGFYKLPNARIHPIHCLA